MSYSAVKYHLIGLTKAVGSLWLNSYGGFNMSRIHRSKQYHCIILRHPYVMYSMCQIIWSTIKQTNTLSGSLCLNTSCDELITVHFIRPRVTLPLETSPFAPRSPRLMATVRWCVSSGKASQSPGLKETAANTQKVQDMWINLAVWGPDVLCAQRWWSKSALRLTYFAEVEANLQVWA